MPPVEAGDDATVGVSGDAPETASTRRTAPIHGRVRWQRPKSGGRALSGRRHFWHHGFVPWSGEKWRRRSPDGVPSRKFVLPFAVCQRFHAAHCAFAGAGSRNPPEQARRRVPGHHRTRCRTVGIYGVLTVCGTVSRHCRVVSASRRPFAPMACDVHATQRPSGRRPGSPEQPCPLRRHHDGTVDQNGMRHHGVDQGVIRQRAIVQPPLVVRRSPSAQR